jgi:hypothetical protein
MSERPEGKAVARHNDLSCTPSARCPSDVSSASVAAKRAYSSYVSEQRSSQRSHSGRAAIFEMRSRRVSSEALTPRDGRARELNVVDAREQVREGQFLVGVGAAERMAERAEDGRG